MRPKYGTREWRIYQCEQTKIARRGRNWKYDPDGIRAKILEEKGYILHDETSFFPHIGNEIVKRLRKEGFFATMLLTANSVRGCPEVCIYKKKK